MKLVLFVLGSIIILFCSCSGSKPKPITIPPTWPINGLTPPPGSMATALPEADKMGLDTKSNYYIDPSQSNQSGKDPQVWILPYQSQISFDNQVLQYETYLEKNNFLVVNHRPTLKVYISSDGKQKVLISSWNAKGDEIYTISIREYGQPEYDTLGRANKFK